MKRLFAKHRHFPVVEPENALDQMDQFSRNLDGSFATAIGFGRCLVLHWTITRGVLLLIAEAGSMRYGATFQLTMLWPGNRSHRQLSD
jgi:hypothetical protein